MMTTEQAIEKAKNEEIRADNNMTKALEIKTDLIKITMQRDALVEAIEYWLCAAEPEGYAEARHKAEEALKLVRGEV